MGTGAMSDSARVRRPVPSLAARLSSWRAGQLAVLSWSIGSPAKKCIVHMHRYPSMRVDTWRGVAWRGAESAPECRLRLWARAMFAAERLRNATR